MNVLVISAHPDDETLGSGGTLLKHAARGDAVSWLIASQGQEPQYSRELIRRKAAEVDRVAEAYGMAKCLRLGLPAARLDTLPIADVMAGIRDAVASVAPEVVYVVYGGDVHTDHQVVFVATMAVLKPFHMAGLGVRRVLCYETLSSTEAAAPLPGRGFTPTVFSDIGGSIDRKLAIMRLYESEAHDDPLPRGPAAIRALARYRGAAIGVDYAEAFALVRELA